MRGTAFTLALCLALATISSVLVAPPAGAGEHGKDKPKKEMSLREKFALPSHIQMSPMMVPIRHRHLTTSAITIFLEPVNKDDVGKICNQVPRIRDAVLQVLSRDPIPTRRNKLRLDGLAGKFTRGINKALDREKIKSVHIEAGMVNLAGKSGGISRLPFATINGCRGIKELQKKIEEAAKKAKEGK